MKTLRNSILFVAFLVLMQSCEKDEDEMCPPNEEEVITTLRMTLTPVGLGNDVFFEFKDLDGDGGNNPVITEGVLSENILYTADIVFLNESVSPIEDITLEVADEALEHQVFFQSSVPNLDIAYADSDANGNPIGLTSQFQTSAAGNGTLNITLIHEPMKDATGVSDGDITNAEGEVDIEVNFDVIVE